MVLQNKYKARASRRYNAARGGNGDGRGRGRGGGRRGGGAGQRLTEDSFPSLPGQESNEDTDGAGDGEEEGSESDDSEKRRQRAKYAPRKMTSNAWRFEGPSQRQQGTEGKEGEGEEEQRRWEEEEEAEEVDLRGLMERVMKLDSSRQSKALSSEQSAKDALDAETADIDASLLHLLDRQRERERRRQQQQQTQNDEQNVSEDFARGGRHDHLRYALTEEQRREMEREGKRLLVEKARQEKHERRARVLQQSAKTISLNIGEQRRTDVRGTDDDKQRPRHSTTTRQPATYSASKLYDDEREGDDGAVARRETTTNTDDVEDFFDELDRPDSRSIRLPVSDTKRDKVFSDNKCSNGAKQSNAGAEEDFLDGLL